MDSTSRTARRPFDEEFFFTWSDSLAWLVGLIWSDGCLSTNSIKFASADRDLAETVAHLIGRAEPRMKANGRAWHVDFSSRRTADWFRNLGLTPRKSLTVRWPVGVPDSLEAAFVRGLLDGDGCFHMQESNQRLTSHLASASIGLVEDYERWLDSHEIAHSRTRLKGSKNPAWQVVVTSRASLERLGSLIYPNPDALCLQRKRTVYERWIEVRGSEEERRERAREHRSEARKQYIAAHPEVREHLSATSRKAWAGRDRSGITESYRQWIEQHPAEWGSRNQKLREYQERKHQERWATDHDTCIDCGKSDRRHHSHGLCQRCRVRQSMRRYRAEGRCP